jgi:SAM-dependent methyltransferase
VLLSLAEAGHRVYGLDHDFGMLAVLQQKLRPELRSGVHIWQGDFTEFQVAKRFELILLPCNTYSTLAPADRKACLQNVYAHLAPDGRFAVSLPNPALLQRLPAHSSAEVEEAFPHPLDGEPVQVSSAWDRRGSLFTVQWHYDHLLPDGQVERVSSVIQHYLTDVSAYEQEMLDAGLGLEARYGDFDFSSYRRQSAYWIGVARLF